MPQKRTSLSVPAPMKLTYTVISQQMDEYCTQKLNEEYTPLCRQALATLCRKKPSPPTRGSFESWACGIIYAIGSANFLFDKASLPYATGQDLADAFGISKSTAAAKGKQVRDWLHITHFSPQWTLPSRLSDNPFTWMLSFEGLLADARHLSPDIQEIAFQKGLIPFLPD